MTSEHQPEPTPGHEQGESHPEGEAPPTASPGSGAGLVERAQRLLNEVQARIKKAFADPDNRNPGAS